MTMDDCPTNEYYVGDLKLRINGTNGLCLSPCSKWTLPPLFGLGKAENIDKGLGLCCSSLKSPRDCRQRAIRDTRYVKLVHSKCPSAYGYNHDDSARTHSCPNNAGFSVTYCQ